MWIKNATVYGISPKAQFPIEQLEAARFVPVGTHELMSSGFVPVRDDEIAYRQGKHILLRFKVEKKVIPASAVAAVVEARCKELEEQQGFPPGKKAKKELKERAFDELLPRALTTSRTTLIWIDQDQHRLVIDSTSNSACDDIIKVLLKYVQDSRNDLGLCDVSWPRAKVVTEWVKDEAPFEFSVDDAAVLRHPGERGKLVKYERAQLSGDDVSGQLGAGAVVEAVAMTFASRLSFVMTQNSQLRKIKPLDVMQEGRDAEKDVDRFDADIALMTRELGILLDRLVQEA
jgi:recombination associated protein RdgC